MASCGIIMFNYVGFYTKKINSIFEKKKERKKRKGEKKGEKKEKKGKKEKTKKGGKGKKEEKKSSVTGEGGSVRAANAG